MELWQMIFQRKPTSISSRKLRVWMNWTYGSVEEAKGLLKDVFVNSFQKIISKNLSEVQCMDDNKIFKIFFIT